MVRDDTREQPVAAWVMDDDDGTTEGDPGALDRPIGYWPTEANPTETIEGGESC